MSSSGNNESREPFFVQLMDAMLDPVRNFSDEAFSGRGTTGESNPIGWLTAPFRFIGGIAVFLVQAWASSRNGVSFLIGIPAVAAIGAFLAGAWFVNFKQNRLYGAAMLGYQVTNTISFEEPEQAPRALEQRSKFAELMVRLRPDSEIDKYQLGTALGAAGDVPRAADIMRMLAPDDQPGMSDAHLWRAGYYQNEAWYQATEEQRDEQVLSQLDLAIQQQEDNKKAHKSMSVIHIRKAATYDQDSVEHREHLEEALTHLGAMVDGGIQSIDHLLATMQIVEIQRQLYGVERAKESYEQLYGSVLEPAAKKFPNIFQIWFVMVKCAVALEDFPLAKKHIREGFISSDSNEVRKKIADLSSMVLLHEADISDDMSSLDDYQTRLYALTRAINVNPKNDEIYKRLVKFIDSGTDHFNMDWFREAKVSAPDPGVLSTMLGLRAMIDGEFKTAYTHLRVSRQLYTLSELVLNHLILVGAKTGLEDFSDPLDLFTKTLEATPDNPILLQSRGYFLIKAGRDSEAVQDLEKAIEKLPNLVEARQFLILTYGKLGDSAQAAYHQQQLSDTLDKLPQEKREKLVERLDAITL